MLPAELAKLRAPHAPQVDQLLYRFARAGTAAEVRADVARIRAALPPGALLGAQSWLTAKLNATRPALRPELRVGSGEREDYEYHRTR